MTNTEALQARLISAVQSNDVEKAKTLITLGCPLDEGKNGVTPLWVASEEGHIEMVRLLLEYGAQVNLPNKIGATSLYIASQNGHADVVQLLIDCGADLNMQKTTGATSLLIASQSGHLDVVRSLVESGARIDLPMKNGVTPYINACFQGHMHVVNYLLRTGASAEAQSLGKTGQQWAKSQNFIGTVACILSARTDVTILRRYYAMLHDYWMSRKAEREQLDLEESTVGATGGSTPTVHSQASHNLDIPRDIGGKRGRRSSVLSQQSATDDSKAQETNETAHTNGPSSKPTPAPYHQHGQPASGAGDEHVNKQDKDKALKDYYANNLVEVGPVASPVSFDTITQRELQRHIDFHNESLRPWPPIVWGKHYAGRWANFHRDHKTVQEDWRIMQQGLNVQQRKLHQTLHEIPDEWLYTLPARDVWESDDWAQLRNNWWSTSGLGDKDLTETELFISSEASKKLSKLISEWENVDLRDPSKVTGECTPTVPTTEEQDESEVGRQLRNAALTHHFSTEPPVVKFEPQGLLNDPNDVDFAPVSEKTSVRSSSARRSEDEVAISEDMLAPSETADVDYGPLEEIKLPEYNAFPPPPGKEPNPARQVYGLEYSSSEMSD